MVFGLIVLVALSHVVTTTVAAAAADEELVYIERRDGSLITYGYETFYITSDKSEVKYRISVPERETNVNLCLRLGKSVDDCRNSIQFVKRVEEGNSIIACGTDATIRTCYMINESGRVQRTFPAHDLVSVKPADWPHWTSVSGTDKIVVVSADQESKFGMHLMRLTGSEAQNDKSFKFGDNHDFYSIVQHDDRVVLFASRQIGDVKRGYIYQMCHNDPGTKESGNSFSQIAKVDLECAHKGQVYRHFVGTQTLNSTNTLGLFAHEYNQDTVLCIINEQSLNKLNFNCSKESNENEVTRVIELSLTEEAIYVDQNVKHVTAMPDWSLFLHSHTTLKKTILQTADVYNNTVGASTPKLQLYNSFESSHALIDVDSVVGWGTELVYLRDGIIGRVQPEQCPYATCVSCMASHDYCDFQGQSCRSGGGGDGELTTACPAPTEERYTKNVEHGAALVLEFDKVKHNITSEHLRIYDELVWYHDHNAIINNTASSDFVMSETNQRAALIIFNPSEQVSQTFTLNVMLNQIVIYTVVYTLALAQARSETPPSTTEATATTTSPMTIDQAATFGNPIIILLLVVVGLLLVVVGALCIRVRRRNVDHDHEKTPMIKSEERAIIVLPGGETKTAKCSDVIHVSGLTSRDDYVQSRLREAINKMN